jgi:hypothetical protein
VERGPLTYSLKIGEKYVRYGGTETWPALEVFPTTAWNYGLVIDSTRSLDEQFKIRTREWPEDNQPFEARAVPLEITARARKIPNWQPDALGLIGAVQPSPILSNEPTETVTLIPMGAARLRISAFPWIGTGPGARAWPASGWSEARIRTRASYCWETDTSAALSDGAVPVNSHDTSLPRFTWWPHQGTAEWVEYEFWVPHGLKQVEVYWFDDTAIGGGCRVPQSWKLLYKSGAQWKEVRKTSAYGVAPDKFNKVTFRTINTTGLRLEVQLQNGASGGILEWRVD